MNRLIFYPTGTYGTFVQWLCNTPNISGPEDLPFHADGNSHQYVLTDQYYLIAREEDAQEFISTEKSNTASCIWPLHHNGKLYNEFCQADFYHQVSQQQLTFFNQNNIKILVLYPTDTSKIWWWHNNCKKVFYNQKMFDKKIKGKYSDVKSESDVDWLTVPDVTKRAQAQMNYYQNRDWYKTLLKELHCANAYHLNLGQLRTVIAHSICNESFDYLSHWQQLPPQFPNIKFVSLDQLRNHTKDTIQDIFKYFDINSELPLDFITAQWTLLQTTRNRDQEHSTVVNCIVNGQDYNWSNLNFDLFDEVYLYHELKYQHNIILDANNIDCLPTNTRDLLRLAR